MKRCVCVCLVAVGLFAGTNAWGQDGSDEPPTPPGAAESAEDDSADQPDAEAWKLLERALNALALNDREAAKRYLEQLHERYPEHPATRASDDALEALGGERSSAFLASPDGEKQPSPGATSGEKATGIARAELAIFQTINGLAVGAELCGVAECQDPRLVIGSLAGGAGLGLGLSLFATRDGITPGHALAINSGTFWGFANGLALHGVLEPPTNFDNRRLPGLMAGGQLAGIAAGHLLYTRFEPSAGDVALMNTTGLWSGVIMMLINGVAQTQEPQVIAISTMAAFDLGLIGGAVLSKHYPMSRGRSFVIDAGGVVGGLTGVGAYLFFTGGEGGARGGFASAVAGTGVGLGLSTFLTRNWDADEELFGDVNLMFAPARQGDGGVVRVGGRF